MWYPRNSNKSAVNQGGVRSWGLHGQMPVHVNQVKFVNGCGHLSSIFTNNWPSTWHDTHILSSHLLLHKSRPPAWLPYTHNCRRKGEQYNLPSNDTENIIDIPYINKKHNCHLLTWVFLSDVVLVCCNVVLFILLLSMLYQRTENIIDIPYTNMIKTNCHLLTFGFLSDAEIVFVYCNVVVFIFLLSMLCWCQGQCNIRTL